MNSIAYNDNREFTRLKISLSLIDRSNRKTNKKKRKEDKRENHNKPKGE